MHSHESLPYFGAVGAGTDGYAARARAFCFNATGHCLGMHSAQARDACPCVNFCCEVYQTMVCPAGSTRGFQPQVGCSWLGHTRDNYPDG